MRLLLCLALAGCGAGHDVFHGDVAFTPEERAQIEEGAAFTASHTRGGPIEIVWDAPHTEDTCDPAVIHRHADGSGAVDYGWRCIVIGVRRNNMPLSALAAHEFGHWRFGNGEHVSHGLMQPLDMPLEWSDEDQALCERSGKC